MRDNRPIQAVMIGPHAQVNEMKLELAARRVKAELERIRGGDAILRVANAEAPGARRFLCSQSLYDDCIVSAEEARRFNCPQCGAPVNPTMEQCAQCAEPVPDGA